MNFKDKKIAVLGFGVEGESVVNFLIAHEAKVTVYDKKKEEEFVKEQVRALQQKGVVFVFEDFSSLTGFDLIVRSPGISILDESLQKVDTPITSATKLFFDLCPCPIVGVTGTKGKGTTSTLIYEMLKKQGIDVYLGGNIGTPPLTFLDKLTSSSYVVLELSSFQLQDLYKSPHIAVMLMVTSEHLDYHKDVYEYIEAKRNILRYQTSTDYAIVNKDYPASNESDIYTEAKVYKVSREQNIDQGCFVRDGAIYLKMSDVEEKILDSSDVALPGKHNLENVCAAVVAAIFAGAKMSAIISVIKTFKGLPHRLEFVKTVHGVRYYNDSFSTTPETAIAAIEAFSEGKILILGGSSKGSDFTQLGRSVTDPHNNVKAIIGIGTEWPLIKSSIINHKSSITRIEGCTTMHEIVEAAAENATLGDIVLLTPACASFDMFKNYKDRGEQFREEVNKL